jgi:hypothetical protein
MGLGEATRTTTYTKSAAHRPLSHMTLMGKVIACERAFKKGWVTRYPVIRLAKLALRALQDDCMASAWRPCDNHVCGAVATSAGEKNTEKSKK